jgi:hypothetical protein
VGTCSNTKEGVDVCKKSFVSNAVVQIFGEERSADACHAPLVRVKESLNSCLYDLKDVNHDA